MAVDAPRLVVHAARVDACQRLQALEQSLSLRERIIAAGDRAHRDQVREIVAEIGGVDIEAPEQLAPHPHFQVYRLLRVDLDGATIIGNRVLDARRLTCTHALN